MKQKTLSICLIFCFLLTGLLFAQETEITGGVSWLCSNQQEDGYWEAENLANTFQATFESLKTLSHFEEGLPYTNGLTWISNQEPINIDFLSRKILILAGTGADTSSMIPTIVDAQNSDGGWGVDTDFASDLLDTALALAALSRAGCTQTARRAWNG